MSKINKELIIKVELEPSKFKEVPLLLEFPYNTYGKEWSNIVSKFVEYFINGDEIQKDNLVNFGYFVALQKTSFYNTDYYFGKINEYEKSKNIASIRIKKIVQHFNSILTPSSKSLLSQFTFIYDDMYYFEVQTNGKFKLKMVVNNINKLFMNSLKFSIRILNNDGDVVFANEYDELNDFDINFFLLVSNFKTKWQNTQTV